MPAAVPSRTHPAWTVSLDARIHNSDRALRCSTDRLHGLSPTFTYTLTVPNDPGVALPGFWYLFALNLKGVPSVSWTVQVTV